jgi:erythromycin esterase
MPGRLVVRLLATSFALIAATGCIVNPFEKTPEDELDDNSIRIQGAPFPWYPVGRNSAPELGNPFEVGLDRTNKRSGEASAYVIGQLAPDTDFGGLGQNVSSLDGLRGKRVRWRAMVRASNLRETGGALWMRVDAPNGTAAFDNMGTRPILGTSEWTEYAVVLDVALDATNIAIGLMVTGTGKMNVDDGVFEVVSASVPTTDMRFVTPPLPDSIASPSRPAVPPVRNLNFEGIGTPPAALEWLRASTVNFAGTEPGASDTDLAPFGSMIGNATVVALGESTHGTREFFRLKHRVFEYLVRNKGFTHFAIEGAWGESGEIDSYVQGGVGDASRLLSRLGFWTWNTEEVRDLIVWMREWNRTAPPNQRVRFQGFDMQSISTPLDSVDAYVTRALPAQRAFVDASLACLTRHRRRGTTAAAPMETYRGQLQTVRTACRAGIDSVTGIMRAQHTTRNTPETAHMLQSMRVVQQWESMASEQSQSRRSVIRDSSMAANVLWLQAQAPSGTRMMLWAHNAHVAAAGPLMGALLRAELGAQYRSVALLFRRGAFNSVGVGSASTLGLRAWSASLIATQSYEEMFSLVDGDFLMFDARQLLSGTGASMREAIGGPLRMRAIGAGYDPVNELTYVTPYRLSENFDHVFFVREGTASRLLPFLPEQ